MLSRSIVLTFRVALGLCLAWLLNGCGGGGATGFPPVVTGFKAQSVQYGHLATLYVGGNDLRSSMTVETSSACTNPALASNSSTTLLVINCAVVAVGDFPLTLKNANGDVVYQTTVTVPKPQVQLTTSIGSITLELDPTSAPVTVNNFLSYAYSGYYTNTLFHRVMPGFVVQGGGFTSGMVTKPGKGAPIVLESNKGLSNLRGTVAMARLSDDTNDPVGSANSATSEFFINLVDNTYLDYKSPTAPGYAVFATVVQGMDVADNMATQPTGNVGLFANVPITDVTITAAQQIK
jgi:cyclophilin family peptidyl-prolyl cis-trans isomerase